MVLALYRRSRGASKDTQASSRKVDRFRWRWAQARPDYLTTQFLGQSQCEHISSISRSASASRAVAVRPHSFLMVAQSTA